MKSKIINEKNEFEVLISIGMIVKNEEKVLGRCLESLQPLMKAIKCELIIADTGSTDSTIEIAKKYTENVFHFEWINDFAAARNSTLEKAKGKWFFFLDADEYLDEDIEEIVHFFSIPELYNKYKTIEIFVRSYSDAEKTIYADGQLARFQRIDDPKDKVKFIGSVHEGIWLRYPLGYFSTILHHTGYCFSSQKQSVNKKERNLVLMREEYKRNPNDLRMLSHLIDGTTHLVEESEKYVQEGLCIAQKEKNHLYRNVVYMQAINFYKDRKPEYALEICEKYYSDNEYASRNMVSTVAISMLKAKILSALGRYKLAVDEFEKYIDLYHDYKNEKLELQDSAAHPIYGTTENEYKKNQLFYVLCLNKLERYNDALKILELFDLTEIKDELFREFLGTLREVCIQSKKYGVLAKYYEKIEKQNNKDKTDFSLYMLESTYYKLVTEKERKDFANEIVKSGAKGKYIDLMKLVLEQNESEFSNNLYSFMSNLGEWKDGFLEAIYLAVKYKLDISNIILRINSVEYRSQLEKIADSNDDFASCVLKYGMPESYMQSIKQFLWLTSLYEKASYRCFNLNDSDKMKLYNGFISLLGDYVTNIYNPELLNDIDIEVTSPLHQFGYFMRKALKNRDEGNDVGYVREMKHALQHCESMREIVSFMLEQFKKTL